MRSSAKLCGNDVVTISMLSSACCKPSGRTDKVASAAALLRALSRLPSDALSGKGVPQLSKLQELRQTAAEEIVKSAQQVLAQGSSTPEDRVARLMISRSVRSRISKNCSAICFLRRSRPRFMRPCWRRVRSFLRRRLRISSLRIGPSCADRADPGDGYSARPRAVGAGAGAAPRKGRHSADDARAGAGGEIGELSVGEGAGSRASCVGSQRRKIGSKW